MRVAPIAMLAVMLAALLAACASPSTVRSTTTTPATESATAVAHQILVTVHQPATLAAGLTGAPNQRYLQRRYGPSPSVDRVLTQLAHEHDLRRIEGWPIQSLDVYCEVLTVPDGRDVAAIVAALNRDPRVDQAQRMNLFNTQAARYDDPYLDLQSAATEMEVERAHELATGRGVSIAIIDSAIDGDHPDLRGRVRLARNLVAEHPLARNGEIHGTAIAGIIASAVNNREGIIGVAPDVSIAALRACWAVVENGLAAQCSSFSLARALELAHGLATERHQPESFRPRRPAVVAAPRSRHRTRHRRRDSASHELGELASVPVVAPPRADGAFVADSRELRLALHAGSSGQRSSDHDARRRLCIPDRQLARGRTHDGRHRVADGTSARPRCRAHRRDSRLRRPRIRRAALRSMRAAPSSALQAARPASRRASRRVFDSASFASDYAATRTTR